MVVVTGFRFTVTGSLINKAPVSAWTKMEPSELIMGSFGAQWDMPRALGKQKRTGRRNPCRVLRWRWDCFMIGPDTLLEVPGRIYRTVLLYYGSTYLVLSTGISRRL